MGETRLYLLCGLPGAGKTTRARRIVEHVSAVYISADDWVLGLGRSLVDYDFRFKLQDQLLAHAGSILRCGTSVVLEFGSWSRAERDGIRQVAVAAGAMTELHFLNAPMDELVERVRTRAGPDADTLISKVLLEYSPRFEPPSPEEIATYDRYVGPDEDWEPVDAELVSAVDEMAKAIRASRRSKRAPKL